MRRLGASSDAVTNTQLVAERKWGAAATISTRLPQSRYFVQDSDARYAEHVVQLAWYMRCERMTRQMSRATLEQNPRLVTNPGVID